MSVLIGIIVLIADIIAIVNCVNSQKSALHKVLWILAILFLPLVGMVLYFLLGKEK